MTQRANIALFILGAVLMSLPGLFTAEMEWAFLAFLAVGYGIMIIATVQSGGGRPSTALTLLVASNLSFWLSYGLWLLRLQFIGPSPESGIDAFAGPVSVWLYLLPTFLLYEGVVFVRGFAMNQERRTAAVGLAASVVQVLITLRVAYTLVQGI